MTYLRYTDSIERPMDGEPDVIADIIATLREQSARTEGQYGHAVRATHAKATGFLLGEFEVPDGLPEELRQGLFARPQRFAALVRFAQGPGELLGDKVSTHRGMAIKLLGVDGPKIPEDDEHGTQDFVLEAGKTFPNADAASFLVTIKGLAKAPLLPESLKNAVSSGARGLNMALEAVGAGSRKLDFFGHPSINPLAESYFSQVPIRYGDYVAKLGVFPATPMQERLRETEIDASGNLDAFRDAVIAYCRSNAAAFEFRVQLATDAERMPIEDATVEWPEDASPYRTVGRLLLPAQNAWSEERRRYFDEALSFRPAHSLLAHRPLGSIMRARLAVYGAMARRRHQLNGVAAYEPRSADEVPA